MTDPDLVEKRLVFIESSVAELRQVSLDTLESSRERRAYVLYTLQMAIKAAIDIALHITTEERAGEPRSYGDAFMVLARHQLLPAELATELKQMAGMRNVIAHQYLDIDLARVRRAVEQDLGDLLTFVSLIRPLL